MPTECNPDLLGFAPVGRREVSERLAACFHDRRCRELVEHSVETLVGQRVFGIALGYEDINDHDELRHDPTMAVLAGKLEAGRVNCAPVAGKSTLNRLELSRAEATRYHKVSHDPAAIESQITGVRGGAREAVLLFPSSCHPLGLITR
jgi:Transposase DDE domain group 1